MTRPPKQLLRQGILVAAGLLVSGFGPVNAATSVTPTKKVYKIKQKTVVQERAPSLKHGEVNGKLIDDNSWVERPCVGRISARNTGCFNTGSDKSQPASDFLLEQGILFLGDKNVRKVRKFIPFLKLYTVYNQHIKLVQNNKLIVIE